MPIRFRPLPLLVTALGLPLALTLTCATSPSNPNAAKYPPQPSGCKMRVFHTAAPDVKEWDDLGITHVDCSLDVGAVQCLKKLRMEACRMGGDLIYDVPKKPLRPSEQGMVYTGHVAHTRQSARDGGQESDDRGGASDQDEPTFEGTGPVQPIEPISPILPSSTSSKAPTVGHAASDGGRPADGGR